MSADRQCRLCLLAQPEAEFYKRRENGKLRTECRDCLKASDRRRRERDPEGTRRRRRQEHLRLRYGLSEADFRSKLEAQNFACAMCLLPFGQETPHVDHDHGCCPGVDTCGRCLRGLLCFRCNRTLGYFETYSALIFRYLASTEKEAHRAAA